MQILKSEYYKIICWCLEWRLGCGAKQFWIYFLKCIQLGGSWGKGFLREHNRSYSIQVILRFFYHLNLDKCCRFYFECLCAHTPDYFHVQFDYGGNGSIFWITGWRILAVVMMPSTPRFYRPPVSVHSLIAVINSWSQKACKNSPLF